MVLKLVKQNKIKQCFLIQFLALCRYLPCFPIWGLFPFLVPLLYFENLSLPCSLFSGLIKSPFDIHPLGMNVSWFVCFYFYLESNLYTLSPSALAILNCDRVPVQSQSISSRDKIKRPCWFYFLKKVSSCILSCQWVPYMG